MSKRRIANLLIAAAILCLVGAVFVFVWKNMEYGSAGIVDGNRPETESTMSTQTEESLAETPVDDETDGGETQPEETTETEPAETEPVLVENPYAESYKENSDMAGWLVIPGTNVDYPIMQTPGDEEYYLRRGFDKEYSSAGCLILDTDSSIDPIGTNLIIHGHNMKAGTMFGHLMEYEDEDYYQEHKNIILYTEECQRNYEVIAVFFSQVYRKSDTVFKFYKFFQANTEEEFLDFYDNIKKLSLYDTGVTAEFGDRFITLSTCSYHVDYGRFVVVAKEVEPGDYYAPLSE